jgi:hypothetical protein
MLKLLLGRMICVTAIAFFLSHAETQAPQQNVDVTLHLVEGHSSSHGNRADHQAPAVAWLKPIGDRNLPFPSHDPYVLLQKNRMFTPHILVVPVGSVVRFPNADPFFHNVFSLFDGKRFDLGLYEAGSTKEVTFSREGLSYIFCNIHPEMSAVVISLSTPLYAIANVDGEIKLRDVPPGEYELHVWVEGEMQPALDKLTRRVRVGSSELDLGEIKLATPPNPLSKHENKFGQPYDQSQKPVY